eukprot:8712128-Alexandrium_andersonii.AAC.1
MDLAVVADRRREARAHLDFAIQLCRAQFARGARFPRERQASATRGVTPSRRACWPSAAWKL